MALARAAILPSGCFMFLLDLGGGVGGGGGGGLCLLRSRLCARLGRPAASKQCNEGGLLVQESAYACCKGLGLLSQEVAVAAWPGRWCGVAGGIRYGYERILFLS